MTALRDAALAALEAIGAGAGPELEEWRVRYLGRRGELTRLLRGIGSLPSEERGPFGQAANRLKVELEERLDASMAETAAMAAPVGAIDVTLPGRRLAVGRYHPTTLGIREITSAFGAMGFQTVEGPEVELDHYNFTAMNMPADHPARDLFDTLWLDRLDENGDRSMLLRTHTSPMQARVMEQQDPPVRVVVPGRVYRHEATDATHEWHLFQVEGLAVDEGITFGDLKGTLYDFARRVFGADRKVRFRCDYFPFVEPGAELAVTCSMCGGKGCRVCKETGWIEVMGCGMVHPQVLRNVNINPDEYSGWAFGFGVERMAQVLYQVPDARMFFENDMRFLRQFS